eukprot:gene27262-33956_t
MNGDIPSPRKPGRPPKTQLSAAQAFTLSLSKDLKKASKILAARDNKTQQPSIKTTKQTNNGTEAVAGYGKMIEPVSVNKSGSKIVNEIYEGNYLNDLRSGSGKYTFGNGEVYEGEWLNGMSHGTGTMTYENG